MAAVPTAKMVNYCVEIVLFAISVRIILLKSLTDIQIIERENDFVVFLLSLGESLQTNNQYWPCFVYEGLLSSLLILS